MSLCRECSEKEDVVKKVTVVYTHDCENCGKAIKKIKKKYRLSREGKEKRDKAIKAYWKRRRKNVTQT